MKISIIIPAWNAEKYIYKCIKSCQRLQGAEFEIIVINDGSSDNTLRIIEENFNNQSNLYVYSTENKGLSAARNYGMKKATGDYIIFLDSDDWLRSDINRIFYNSKLLNNIDVLFYNYQIIDEFDDNRLYPVREFPVDFGKVYTGEEIFSLSRDKYVSAGFVHFAWLGIYNRKFLEENNIWFTNGIIYEDYDFWFNVIRNAKKIRYSWQISYAYRLRDNSITHSGFSKKVIDSVFVIISNILGIDRLSDAYLACAGAKIELLMIYAEMRTSSRNADYLEKDIFEESIRKKENVITIIDEKYPEDSLDWIKIKYRLLSHVVFSFGIYDEKMVVRLQTLREKIMGIIIPDMNTWNLSEPNKKIGLYGLDQQSDVLINTFIELMGEVKAECVYIDRDIKSHSKKHYNRDIINVSDIDKENIDTVIICSNIRESSMRSLVESYKNIKIISPYRKSHISYMWVICGNYYEIYKHLNDTQGKKRLILLETPEYPNIGDQLITVSEYEFFHEHFSEYEIVEITNEEYAFYKCRIKRMIVKDDILVITGGGFFGSLWREFHYDQALDIITGYPENEIWVMPQSIYFEDNEMGEKYKTLTMEAFSRKKLKIICRERFSLNALQGIGVDKEKVFLGLDIALFHKYQNSNVRQQNIGMFFRYDKESIFERKEKELIERILVNSGLELVPSSMQYECTIHKQERNLVVEQKLEEISKYKLVVTDTLHCMISCLITRTPCIAFNNISRKLEGVYEFLKDIPYIVFLKDVSMFEKTLNDMLEFDVNDVVYPCFESYWENIKRFLA